MRVHKRLTLGNKKKQSEYMTIYVFTDNHNKDGVAGDPFAQGAITADWTRLHYQQNQKFELFVQDVLNDNPDLVLGLGDFFDVPPALQHFKNNWSQIPEPKALMLGNHDYSLQGFDTSSVEDNFQWLVDELNITTPVIVGSPLNYTFYQEKDGLRVKFIMCDFSLKKENDEIVHHADYIGTIIPEQLDWILSEINNSTTDTIMICSHHGMHKGVYFNNEDAQSLKDTLSQAKTLNPNVKLFGVFGHHHVHKPTLDTSMRPELYCVNASAHIERFKWIEESKHTTYYTIIKLYKDEMQIDMKPLTYTGLQPTEWDV